MSVRIFSASMFGFDCRVVEVEVDILNGLASISIVGLGDAAVQESKERIRSAIKNSGLEYPRRKKTINLAPADVRKHGPMFDLPIALGLLMQSGQIPAGCLDSTLVVGELSLSGELRSIPGVLPIAAHAADENKSAHWSAAVQNFKKIIIPALNAPEASVIKNIEIIPAKNLQQLVAHLCGQREIEKFRADNVRSAYANARGGTPANDELDGLWHFEDIRGHEHAKRALIIAAAGNHSILLYGPPGSGKTLLARCFQGILPPLELAESIEVTKLYSIAGKLALGQSLITRPPFRAVHHTASAVSLVGGGSIPRPGEISLAHKGILFLDELLEFPRSTLDCLRQPMEDGRVNIARARGSVAFPAEFTLIAATNPCMCGYYGDPVKACSCTPSQLQNYRKKISGPLLDRIDLVCNVPRLPLEKITSLNVGESSQIIRERISYARQIQQKRLRENSGALTNGQMGSKEVKNFCSLDERAAELLKESFLRFKYSGRSYYRILKVARTIADLDCARDGSESGAQDSAQKIKEYHLAEALQYRSRGDAFTG